MDFKIFVLTLFLLSLCVPLGCAAASISVSPDAIEEGDEIEINIQDLPDGASFAILVESRIEVEGGEKFTFEVQDFVLPVSLSGGWIFASTKNTAFTTLSTTFDGSSINVGGPSKDGVFTFSQQMDIPAGTYRSLKLEGQAMPDVSEITTQMRLSGEKTGAADSTISFTLNGVSKGSSTIEVSVDGETTLRETIPIGGGTPEEPTTKPTKVPTTEKPSGTPGSPGSPGSSGPSGSTTQQNDGVTPTGAVTTAPGVGVVWSEDRMVRLEGSGLEGVGLTRAESGNVPDGWVPLGDAVSITPANRTFEGPVQLIFTLPEGEAENQATIFIAVFNNEKWEILPSNLEDGTVVTEITGAGTYRLMHFAEAETTAIPTTTATTLPQTTQSSVGYACLIATVLLSFVLLRGKK
ncbi:hypothetical protein E2N92_00060 [Methanofollis formosanus]|uniref:Uncharacterized protein n=1 Tax=Methanofollis formosanus TaxID=299308 RepID=A0A8G0ZY07_9EURY|nr:hypothetical protein [Methanofollis formosanus]QYZ77930.1 hypothetical protein E2N92_00060 [Methanofollis formosanus]